MVWKNCTLVMFLVVVGCVSALAQNAGSAGDAPVPTQVDFCSPVCGSAAATTYLPAPDWLNIGIGQSFQSLDALIPTNACNLLPGASMSCGTLATSRAVRSLRRRSACFG
jgi:hypothetical protein